MKIIGTFLTVCGVMVPQAPQAANPVQQSTENAARMAAGAGTEIGTPMPAW